MKILDREFIGPLKLEYKELPRSSCAYIIAHTYKGNIKPIYIGFAKDLRMRVHAFLTPNANRVVIPKEVIEDDSLELFYSIFEPEDYSKGQDFEKELIEFFQPTYNSKSLHKNKDFQKAFRVNLSEKKAEKVRDFSSVVAGIASSLALFAAVSLSSGLFFDKKDDSTTKPGFTDTKKILADYQKAIVKLEKSEKDVAAIKSELNSLNSKPVSASWSIESNRINQRVLLVESKLSALDAALTVDPAKSLAIPLLRKDLDNTQSAFKIELTQTKAEVDRVYDQNKWFIGLMITVAIAVLSMAVNNFFSKKS